MVFQDEDFKLVSIEDKEDEYDLFFKKNDEFYLVNHGIDMNGAIHKIVCNRLNKPWYTFDVDSDTDIYTNEYLNSVIDLRTQFMLSELEENEK